MGIALLSVVGLFKPLHTLAGRWPALHRRSRPAVRHFAARLACATRPATVPPPSALPLRVVRLVDAGEARAAAGRMVISGRMADVCAELDRLAALEAAASPR